VSVTEMNATRYSETAVTTHDCNMKLKSHISHLIQLKTRLSNVTWTTSFDNHIFTYQFQSKTHRNTLARLRSSDNKTIYIISVTKKDEGKNQQGLKETFGTTVRWKETGLREYVIKYGF
jgi:hypothetical protein